MLRVYVCRGSDINSEPFRNTSDDCYYEEMESNQKRHIKLTCCLYFPQETRTENTHPEKRI